MSVRSAERSKAVRLAWEREQELVSKGECTRDWTREQQQDILDPEKGKAYDDEGRAFEGQHMKSVNKYPEYADNPDDIQFLTRKEHLEAHKGNWNNPTNWYYNPVTKTFHEFEEDELIPCEIFFLSNPVATITQTSEQVEKNADDDLPTEEERKKEQSNSSDHSRSEPNQAQRRTEFETASQENASKSSGFTGTTKSEGGFFKKAKSVGRFIIDHPKESLQIAGVFVGAIKGISSLVGTRSVNKNSNDTTFEVKPNSSSDAPVKTDIATTISEIVEKANKSSPREHEVPGHRQRYHTKRGVVWKDKNPYSRGGKKD